MADSKNRWLLVTDVDDTLLGDAEAFAAFEDVASSSPDLMVVLNSSRPVASVMETLAGMTPRLQPTAVIGAMGTEILYKGRFVAEWSARFGDWSRAPIDHAMTKLGFRPHDAEFQTPFKASYEVPDVQARGKAEAAVKATGQPFKIVASGVSDFDVLPPNADKGDATMFAAEMLGVSEDRLIVAGDSGNDIAMFNVAARGIVVGNARGELRRAVDRRRTYRAVGQYAHGLIEGLRHYDAPIQTQRAIQ